eukprot:COSAG02_NODE_66682_length_254_cov_17.625806_2_plen_32_part_01
MSAEADLVCMLIAVGAAGVVVSTQPNRWQTQE